MKSGEASLVVAFLITLGAASSSFVAAQPAGVEAENAAREVEREAWQKEMEARREYQQKEREEWKRQQEREREEYQAGIVKLLLKRGEMRVTRNGSSAHHAALWAHVTSRQVAKARSRNSW